MSVYPVFDIQSIFNWCNKDVADFIAQEKKKNASLNLNTGFALTTEGLENKDACEEAVKPFVEFINRNLLKDENGEIKTYVNSISEITDPELQNQLWIARTFLFSQLMIFAVVILGKDNDTMYNTVFENPMHLFMSDVAAQLKLYQMGIFGSKSPTSDIDVGIQYTGDSLNPTLHYILYVFEQLFLTFTGKSSLDFDIEAYADLYLIQDAGGKDYFYLDTGNLTKDNFKEILPVAGLSIARNVLMDNHNATPTFDDIISDVNAASKSTPFADSIEPELLSVLKDPTLTWLSESMTAMQTFLNSNYDGQRAKYYQAVLAAEKMKFEVAPTFDDAKKLTSTENNEKRCKLINLVGTALAYRMESYSAAPTITHVVRILQANKDAVEKYRTISPTELCNPTGLAENAAYCAIGKYGFVMSILEQMGYMSRFYQHYCIGDHPDKAKCDKKMKKYGDRYVDGFIQYKRHVGVSDVAKTFVESATTQAITKMTEPSTRKEGGKRRRTRRGTKVQRRKTLKRGRNRKNRTRK
jgi:hypothetical protein